MNSIFKEMEVEIQTKFKRPLQAKSSKAQIQAKFHKIPVATAFARKGLLHIKTNFCHNVAFFS